jgi:hypothetical protein
MIKQLEVEIDGQRNECLSFRPLPGRKVRGRFDINRISEPMARLQTAQWPLPIPSQKLGIDAGGTGYIAEPLHDADHAPIKEKIVKAGMKLAPEIEMFDNIDVPSWLFWIKRAVESGIAKVVKGQLPDKIEGTPRKNFITAAPEAEPIDRMTAALEKQSALFERLLEKLSK